MWLALAGLSSLGVPGVPWHTQILADQLTLFQPGGTDYAHLITTGTPGFSDLPTALPSQHQMILWKSFVLSILCSPWCTCFGSTYTKIGTIQRRLAWPLRKDDTQNREAFHIFCPGALKTLSCRQTTLFEMRKKLQNSTPVGPGIYVNWFGPFSVFNSLWCRTQLPSADAPKWVPM